MSERPQDAKHPLASGASTIEEQFAKVSGLLYRFALYLLFTISLVTGKAAAQSGGTSCGSMPEQFREIATLLTQIQQLGIALALLIASTMIVYGGILWMRGTPDSQQKARHIIFNSLVGLVIVLMAGGLVEFVTNILCGGGG